MKKILLILTLLLNFNLMVFANETPINVIYIHGSNQDNLGGAEAFAVWMNKMHKDLKKNFENNSFMKEHLLLNAYIAPEPDMIYWGGRIKHDKSFMEAGLSKSAKSSSKVVQIARKLVGEVVHDAVWLQKYNNLVPTLEELNGKIIENYKKGEKTIIVGYSAGTFVTISYLLTKVPLIDMADLFNICKDQYNLTNKDIELANKYVKHNTCVSSAIQSKVFYVNNMGKIEINSDSKQRETGLAKIEKNTELYCSPDGALKGILNFGSPIIVFYTGLVDSGSIQQYVFYKAMQNIVETDKFYMSINYSKDPIAVSTPDYTYDILTQNQYTKNIKNGGGIIYDTLVRGGANMAGAHTNYWKYTNSYTKAVAKAYENGYKYFYSK